MRIPACQHDLLAVGRPQTVRLHTRPLPANLTPGARHHIYPHRIASPRYPGGILIEIKPATTTTDLISRAEKAFNHAGTATVLALGAVTTLQGGTAAPYPAGMGHTITPCVSPAEMGAWKERGTTWWLRCIDCNRLAYFNSNAVQPQCALCSAPTHGTARIMDLARDMDLDYHPARHAARLWHEAQNATMARKPRPRT